MLNTPWETGSPLYRRLVITALVLTGIGILIAVTGAATGNNGVVFAAMPVIVAGLLTHVAGLVIRGRDAKRRHQMRTGKK